LSHRLKLLQDKHVGQLVLMSEITVPGAGEVWIMGI